MKQFSPRLRVPVATFIWRNSLLFFLLLLSCLTLHAQQTTTIQESVHFKKNKFTLTDDAKLILDKIKDSLGDYVIEKIIIKGYTDSDADSAYNAKLSENRCQSVKAYLSAAGIDSTKFYIAAYGEEFPVAENSTEHNKSRNRRVDILVTMSFPTIVKKIPGAKDTCLKDTLVDMGSGVMMLVNKCSYKTNPGCMTVTIQRKEEYDVKYSRFRHRMGFKNYHKKKNKRVIYYARVQCKDSTCGNDGRQLYIPTYEVKEKKVSVLKYDSVQGEFVKQKEPKVKSVKKKSYAQVALDCRGGGGSTYIIPCGTGWFWCGGCMYSKIKFKDGIKILKADMFLDMERQISADSSTLYFHAEYGIRKLVLLDGSDTTTLEGIQVTALHHGSRRIKSCKKNAYFLYIPYRKRCPYYRKYKFRRPDLTFQHRRIWVTEIQ